MFQDGTQQQFLELVGAGLFPERGARKLVHGIPVDWEEVYRLAEKQSVLGLVAAGIESLPESERPLQGVVLQFVGATLQLEQRNRAMNEFISRLTNELRTKDIYAILVKGQGMAQCYERPFWRTCGDVDLLLSKANYEEAKKYLHPKASNTEKEYSHFKHQGMTIDEWVVELHGTLHSRLSGRVDKMIDEVQSNVFNYGKVRSWQNGKTQVLLPAPDEDVVFVFTHILHHYFFEGIGLRQICDWCRLLWTYQDQIDENLLEVRLSKAGIMSEWKAFAAMVVDWLGMPKEAMPLYDADEKWSKKAERVLRFVMKVGNFGHESRRNYSGMSYVKRKFISFWGRQSDMLRHFRIFPLDSIIFFSGVIKSGLHAVVRGE